MRNDRGYTYLITNGREYKIGITTKTPVSRVAELQTGSPTKILISGYSYNSNALAMEIELHKMFASKRLEGEWFALSDDDVAIIHHHFETNYLDEYFAPLSARAVEIKRKEKEREAEKLEAEKRLIKEKKERAIKEWEQLDLDALPDEYKYRTLSNGKIIVNNKGERMLNPRNVLIENAKIFNRKQARKKEKERVIKEWEQLDLDALPDEYKYRTLSNGENMVNDKGERMLHPKIILIENAKIFNQKQARKKEK